MEIHGSCLGLKNVSKRKLFSTNDLYTTRAVVEKSMKHTRQEEGIMLVSSWMLLGLEQGVKVPE